jgi:hypothetical protein
MVNFLRNHGNDKFVLIISGKNPLIMKKKVINMKWKMLFIALGFIFSVPSFVTAHPSMHSIDGDKEKIAPCDCQDDKQHHMMNRDWEEKIAERDQKLLSLVNQYTPERKADWTKVLDEKKALYSQWKSPENMKKREQWKKDKMAKMQELKKLLDEGKITKEEFMQKAHNSKMIGPWKAYHDLEIAVEAKNNKKAATLLNQLLEQYKLHNQMLKEMIK